MTVLIVLAIFAYFTIGVVIANITDSPALGGDEITLGLFWPMFMSLFLVGRVVGILFNLAALPGRLISKKIKESVK